MQKIIPIILSGGIGSRLWPVSRSQRPKPFMWVESDGSLLAKTFSRVQGLKPDCIISVTNVDYGLQTHSTADALTIPHHMILEPQPRNTAGAIGIASAYVADTFGDDAIMVVLPSDHIIKNTESFITTVQSAVAIAQQGQLVTMGIAPTKPHTGYGYIQMGDTLNDGAYTVKSFVEKPDLATAESYIQSGDYLWNAGMFVFTPQVYLSALQHHAPDVYDVVQKCHATNTPATVGATDTTNATTVNAETFATMPDISVDYAVMERADNVAVIPAQFDWNDLGAWDSVAETLPTDGSNNHTKGQAVLHDTQNTTVFSTSDDKLITTVGLDNVTIVETRDAVLVADSTKLQGVKNIVKTLTDQNHPAVHQHRTEHRPWGTFSILDEGENYKVKQIMVLPNSFLSLQSHNHRSEHWVIVAGQATVVNGDKTLTLNPNQSTYIPQGTKHRLANETNTPVVMIEVQTGDYFGEDDIVRYEDSYGRG